MELISAKEVFKKVDPDAQYLFKSKMGNIYWSEYPPKSGEDGCIHCPDQGKIGLWSSTNNIKEFQVLPPEDCVIENSSVISKMIGKLCWFWDEHLEDEASQNYISYENRIIGILDSYSNNTPHPYCIKGSFEVFSNCEPVQKSELKGMLYNGK